MDPLSRATAIVKTFERPECLESLLSSLRAFFPDLAVMVGDDSCFEDMRETNRAACEAHGAVYVALPDDCGLSFGRNRLLERVTTPFFFLLDDDFIFTERTRLDALLDRLERHELDIVAGSVEMYGERKHYEGTLERAGSSLRYVRGGHSAVGDVTLCDLVFNFYAGRTASILRIGWDDELKLAEHTDFFLRAKGLLKVGYFGEVEVTNSKTMPSARYERMRHRGNGFFTLFVRKHALREVINFDGGYFRM